MTDVRTFIYNFSAIAWTCNVFVSMRQTTQYMIIGGLRVRHFQNPGYDEVGVFWWTAHHDFQPFSAKHDSMTIKRSPQSHQSSRGANVCFPTTFHRCTKAKLKEWLACPVKATSTVASSDPRMWRGNAPVSSDFTLCVGNLQYIILYVCFRLWMSQIIDQSKKHLPFEL